MHMRILLLTHRLPYPPNKGDKIRSFHILEHLARTHEIYLACPIDDPQDLQYLEKVQERAAQVLFERIDGRGRARAAVQALMSLGSITVSHFYSPALARRIDALMDEHTMDAIFCFSSPMAEYLFRSRHAAGKIRQARRIMDLIDVDSFKWSQYAQRTAPPRSWIYRYEAARLASYERRIAAYFDRLFLVSDQECRYLPPGARTDRWRALSNGVDLQYFAPSPSDSASTSVPTLVFTGVMDYWPNVQGVQWFADEVLPKIVAAVPGTRFVVVGSKPTEAVLRLADRPGIAVTGYVEDVRTYLRNASVCVVPLKIARGLQNKVLEAMAMGKAVVSTPEAIEGIRAEVGVDVLVAGDAPAFAAAVIDLLKSRERAGEIGGRARRCMEKSYSWEANLRVLDEALPHTAPKQSCGG